MAYGPRFAINAVTKINEKELSSGVDLASSWHNQFKDSAYVHIGGIHLGASEGDVITVFSQFGEIVDINLVRHKDTGKSRGFCFLAYEDQRSTILAVDNMNGYELLKKVIKVDHVLNYKAPRKFDKDNLDEEGFEKVIEYQATGAEGKGIDTHNVIDSQVRFSRGSTLTNAQPAGGAVKDADETWAEEFENALAVGKEEKKDEKKRKKDKKEKKKRKKEKKSKKEVKKQDKKDDRKKDRKK